MLSKYSTSEEICGLVNQIVNEALYSKKYQMSFSTRSLEGMSGQRFRKLLNKLICDLNVTKYLEIGTFRGITAISALYRNGQCRGLLVDNFSQFGAEKRKLISNLNKFKVLSRVNLIDSDFRECIQDLKNFSPKVFFYDGSHDDSSHELAAELLEEFTRNEDILFVVDDWNWISVRESTWRGIKKSGVRVKGKWEIFSDSRDRGGQFGNWHNGSLIAIISSKYQP